MDDYPYTLNIESFPPEYQNVYSELKNQIELFPNKRFENLDEFSQNYFMTNDLWSKLIECIRDPFTSEEGKQQAEIVFQKGAQHFYFNEFCDDYIKLMHKFLHPSSGYWYPVALMKNYDFAEKEVSFPNELLKDRFRLYNEYSSCPISPEIISMYEKNLKHFNKIMSVNGNDEKWLKYILEVEDEEFITMNIEHRIGRNLLNKNMWKLYINYLHNKNIKKMLEVYSKYVRLFLDDKEMLEKYKKETKKLGHPEICVPWKNPMDFENIKLRVLEKKELKGNPKIEKHVFVKTNFKCPRSQKLPFRATLINYVLKNIRLPSLQKLYQTCKLYFARIQIPICHRLALGFFERRDGPKIEFIDFDRESMHISKKNLFSDSPFENLFISNSLSVYCLTDQTQLSKFIPKIEKCDIKFLHIQMQNFSFDEYFFLVGARNVVSLEFMEVEIKKENNILASLEEIMSELPKIRYLSLCRSTITTDQTSRELKKLKFKNKIEYFWFSTNLDEDFLIEPHEFAEFIEKTMMHGAQILLFRPLPHFRMIIQDHFKNPMLFNIICF